MSSDQIQVFVAYFDNETEAKEALNDFKAMKKQGSIDLIDAAVIVRSADGKVKYEETVDPDGKTWGKRGAIAGGLVGLIFPPTLLVSAAVGGGAGAIWGKVRAKGIKDDDLKEIGESMDPGTSAIIAIAQDRVVDQLQAGLEGYERLARHALSAEAAVAISAEATAEEKEEADEEQEPKAPSS
jgi:uncharacterized membrane protein